MSFSSMPSVPNGPFHDLEEGKITGDEYAYRVRREVRERIREEPPPDRSPSEPVPAPAPERTGREELGEDRQVGVQSDALNAAKRARARETDRSRKLYRSRGAVEREFGRPGSGGGAGRPCAHILASTPARPSTEALADRESLALADQARRS